MLAWPPILTPPAPCLFEGGLPVGRAALLHVELHTSSQLPWSLLASFPPPLPSLPPPDPTGTVHTHPHSQPPSQPWWPAGRKGSGYLVNDLPAPTSEQGKPLSLAKGGSGVYCHLLLAHPTRNPQDHRRQPPLCTYQGKRAGKGRTRARPWPRLSRPRLLTPHTPSPQHLRLSLSPGRGRTQGCSETGLS